MVLEIEHGFLQDISNSLIAQWGNSEGGDTSWKLITLPITYEHTYSVVLTISVAYAWGCCPCVMDKTITSFKHNGQNEGGNWGCYPCDYFTIGY